MLNDMSILTETPISNEILVFAMYLDLLQSTQNPELKQAIERILIKMFNSIQ